MYQKKNKTDLTFLGDIMRKESLETIILTWKWQGKARSNLHNKIIEITRFGRDNEKKY